MVWVPYGAAVTPTAGAMMTINTPPAMPTPANNRSWTPAVATARQTARAVPVANATGSEVALRGDHRTPAQIDAAGGLWSHSHGQAAAGPTVADPTRGAMLLGQHRSPTAAARNVGHNQHDPDVHQAFANPTRIVSFTRDIQVAKGFAGGNGHVYLVRVNKGVDYNAYRAGNGMQAEVMAVQGVALQDIIAARSMATNQIQINLAFQQANMPPAIFNAAMQLLMS